MSRRVVMLLGNAYRPDPRVAREATSLVEAGHQVTVIAWDREGEGPGEEVRDGVRVLRVQGVRTHYGAGWRQLFYTPRFWWAATGIAQKLAPEIVHCHDLDTLCAGVRLRRKLGCQLVYDAHENYAALMSAYLPRPFVPALSLLERSLLGSVDFAITASTAFADGLRERGVERVTTVGNYASLESFDALSQQQVADARTRLALSPDAYVVAYIGGFTRNRLLLPLIEAAARMPDVVVLLWGRGHQEREVKQAVAGTENVRYLGWLPAEQVPLHTRMADVVYYCLRPDDPSARYNAPNTLSNAMAAGIPVLANDVGDLGRIVRTAGCGLLLDDVTADRVAQGLAWLRAPEMRLPLGRAGRQAAEQTYNWSRAADQLLHVYAHLS